MVLVRELEKFARESLDARGYQEISTPMLVNKKLWEQSGHWDYYSDNMFKFEVEEETFSLKPMNCPESSYVYRRALRSYRDLPIRYSEMGRCHRNERSGTLTGLIRVRQFTQDDAHIYLRPTRSRAEITDLLDLVREWYGTFDLRPSYRLATRPPDKLGTEQQWDQAEDALHEALRANGLTCDLDKGGGAFYGPKIDIDVEDTLGRQWQLATIQVDPDHAARAHAVRVHRHRRPAQAAGGDPPRDLRLLRALHRHPHRALRGRVPDVARARAGARACPSARSTRVRESGAAQAPRGRASAPS
jgi:threonyl-tRNA synthetase